MGRRLETSKENRSVQGMKWVWRDGRDMRLEVEMNERESQSIVDWYGHLCFFVQPDLSSDRTAKECMK